MTDDPIEDEHREAMRGLARGLDQLFNGNERPKKIGFALVIRRFDTPGKVNYISNAKREDIVLMMREFIARNEEQTQ
jgi:hypothetical protein